MADVLTTVGKAYITSVLASSDAKWVAWGTGTTGAVVADTAIESESGEDRTDGTQSQQTTTTTNDTYRVVGLIESESTQTIGNAGVLTASTSGTLVLHSNFTGVPLVSGDSINFTFNLKQA